MKLKTFIDMDSHCTVYSDTNDESLKEKRVLVLFPDAVKSENAFIFDATDEQRICNALSKLISDYRKDSEPKITDTFEALEDYMSEECDDVPGFERSGGCRMYHEEIFFGDEGREMMESFIQDVYCFVDRKTHQQRKDALAKVKSVLSKYEMKLLNLQEITDMDRIYECDMMEPEDMESWMLFGSWVLKHDTFKNKKVKDL